jgi:SPX domain protein involved in polyphosphate accumulation
MTAPWALDRTLRSRFECKYLVSEGMAQEILRFTTPYLEPDFFSARQKNHQYPVHSLYLDSPQHELYQTTIQGLKNRFKLRIRGYDSKPDSPLFAEVKRRSDRVILKKRALVDRPIAEALLRGAPLPDTEMAQNQDFIEFRNLSARLTARPAVYVSYLREAHEAYGAEPARLTLDRSLRNAAVDLHTPFAFDNQRWHETPCDKVILELKFTDACPHWLEVLVETFQLDRCSVAKYIMCLENSLERQHQSPSFYS